MTRFSCALSFELCFLCAAVLIRVFRVDSWMLLIQAQKDNIHELTRINTKHTNQNRAEKTKLKNQRPKTQGRRPKHQAPSSHFLHSQRLRSLECCPNSLR